MEAMKHILDNLDAMGCLILATTIIIGVLWLWFKVVAP